MVPSRYFGIANRFIFGVAPHALGGAPGDT